MVWGRISFRHRTPLIVIDGTLTAQCYINEVLRPAVVPFFAAHCDVTQFQQDNMLPHSACLTTAFLRQQGINMLPWPALSPDQSPIEHLWDQLGRAARQRHSQPQARRHLEAVLQAETRNITQAEYVLSVLCLGDAVRVLQQAEDTLGTDFRILISMVVVLLIVVIHCTIKYSISNTRCSFLKTI